MKPKILLFWLVIPTKVWLVRGLLSVNKKKGFKKDLTISIGTPQSTTIMKNPYISSYWNIFYLCFLRLVLGTFLPHFCFQKEITMGKLLKQFQTLARFSSNSHKILFCFHIYFSKMLAIFVVRSFLVKNEININTNYVLLSICQRLMYLLLLLLLN